MPWYCLVLFCTAFAACVVTTPWVTVLARYLGAVDAPDGFRKVGHAATPRMGGLAVAFGFITAMVFYALTASHGTNTLWDDLPLDEPGTLAALLLMLAVGMVDDRRGLSATIKLGFQALAAALLFHAGFRIEKLFLFGVNVDLGWLSLPITCFWFIGCMNVWNLIDGMDGLASGVSAIVGITLMLAATSMLHLEVAYAAAGLAGAAVGFLMFNFHPARIFLGDTGSLFLGTMLGMLAIRGSLKSGVTVAIFVPLLAMGLPIIDTLLALLRRWIRRLPWNTPDRGHLHHRLIAFGLSTRQASLFLYSFTLLLCAGALTSLALQSDSLGVSFALLGTLGLAAVFVARREQRLAILNDFKERLVLRKLEQNAARIVWEGIQRLSFSGTSQKTLGEFESVAGKLGCDYYRLAYFREGFLQQERRGRPANLPATNLQSESARERVQWRFTIADWPGEELLVELQQNEGDERLLAVGGPFLNRLARELLVKLRLQCAEESANPQKLAMSAMGLPALGATG